MKLLVMPSSIKQVNNLINKIDGIIIGVDLLSVNMPFNFTLKDVFKLQKICKDNEKEIFVSLNKNMHNTDLELLEKTMIELDGKVNGILFYDVALVNIKNRLQLKTDLVWSQEHLTTNALTSEFWSKNGVKYTFVSSDITADEVTEISASTSSQRILLVFGHLPIFVSKRELVSNYKKTFDIKDESEIYYFCLDDNYYPIIEHQGNTYAFTAKVLNAIAEVPTLGIDYMVLNSFLIKDADFSKVVSLYSNVDESNKDEYKEILENMFNTDSGFLYKETVYKVKTNE